MNVLYFWFVIESCFDWKMETCDLNYCERSIEIGKRLGQFLSSSCSFCFAFTHFSKARANTKVNWFDSSIFYRLKKSWHSVVSFNYENVDEQSTVFSNIVNFSSSVSYLIKWNKSVLFVTYCMLKVLIFT